MSTPLERKLDLEVSPWLAARSDEQERQKVIVDLFKILNDHYRNDINAVWQRSQFFVAAQGGLIAFVSSKSVNPGAITTLAMIGAVLASLWLAGAIVTVRWVGIWRETVVAVESRLFICGPFSLREPGRSWYHIVRPHHLSWITASVALGYWLYVFCNGVPWALLI